MEVVGKVMSGNDQLAMSNDFIKVLRDNPAVFYLGFGRFMSGSLTPVQFASLDLRSLNLLVALCRCINDTSFRRQTKGDSNMPISLVRAEQPYSFAVLAAMRGVQSMVSMMNPVPIAFSMAAADGYFML